MVKICSRQNCTVITTEKYQRRWKFADQLGNHDDEDRNHDDIDLYAHNNDEDDDDDNGEDDDDDNDEDDDDDTI